MTKENRCSADALLRSFAALLILSLSATGNVSAAQQQPASDKTKLDSNILQFKSGDHIVGFTPERAYFVSTGHALSIEFLGANKVKPQALTLAENKDTKKGPAPLGKVEYKKLWPGITLKYDAVKGGLAESTYIIAPGADVSKIRLKYNVPVTLQKDGSLKLIVKSKLGSMTESAPVAWQEINGKKVPVKVAFKVANGEIGFITDKYNARFPLIIDPTLAGTSSWTTSGGQYGNAMALDNDGNIYITGNSYHSWNGPSDSPPLHPHSGDFDIFVMKLNSHGSYQWHTFYGSSNSDNGTAIAVDSMGNIYIAGNSDSSWGSPLHPHSGGLSTFVLKLKTDGAYQWHTFYGPNYNSGYASGIALDSNNNVYVAGYCTYTWGAPLHAHSGSGSNIFALKLNPEGAYQWHTFYGANDWAYAIAVDANANIYLTGGSYHSWGSPLHTFSELQSIVVLKLDTNGAYLWHTFYGAGNSNKGEGISTDCNGNVYVTGSSNDQWWSPLHNQNGYSVAFILKLDSAGAYKWHTLYGWNDVDIGSGIAADCRENVYTTGYNRLASGTDYSAFILKINSSGEYRWSTISDSSTSTVATGTAVDRNGNFYVIINSRPAGNGEQPPYTIAIQRYIPTTCPENAAMLLAPGGAQYFSAPSAAYAAAASGDVLQVQAGTFTGNANMNTDINITLKGGYECDFLSQPGWSTLKGTVTISKGSVIVENIIIR